MDEQEITTPEEVRVEEGRVADTDKVAAVPPGKRPTARTRRLEAVTRKRDEGDEALTGLKETAKLVAEVAVLALVIYLFVFQISIVKGDSMRPTFADGDRLIVDQVTYRFGDIERFDVVIFHGMAGAEEKDYIKRVIGLPGETVALRNGALLIDGRTVVQDFAFRNQVEELMAHPVEVLPDHYFVLGDNRPYSTDSRTAIGQVPASSVRGRVRLRVWPLDRLSWF